MRKHFIYALTCPISNKVRYVGQTIDLNKRMNSHINYSKNHSTHKANWINSLLKENLEPNIMVLEECDSNDVNDREIYWIKRFRDSGHNLTNSTNGGEGTVGHIFSDEHRRKLSESSKGRKHSKETKNKIRNIMISDNSPVKGRIFSDEHRRKLSESSKGRKHSKETKNKIGESVSGSNNAFSIRIKVTKKDRTYVIYDSIKDVMSKYKISRHLVKKYCVSAEYYNELKFEYL